MVQFVKANSQYFRRDSIITPINTPLLVGAWVCPTAAPVSGATMGGIGTVATAINGCHIGMTSTPAWIAQSASAGTAIFVGAGTPTVGRWAFVLGRFINSTNRWVMVFDPVTGVASGQSITSNVPATPFTRATIGSNNLTTPTAFVDVLINEFWYTDDDLQFDPNAAFPSEFIIKLAMEGPFACPEMGDTLVEYRRMNSRIGAVVQRDQFTIGDAYMRDGLTATSWASVVVNAPIGESPMPPYLSPTYQRPGQVAPILVI